MIGVYWMFRHSTPPKMDWYFRKLQLVSAAIFSYAHGTNDAQKTMGIITGVLVTAGYLKTFIGADLGDSVGARGHRAGHAERRLAHHPHHGLRASPA